MLSEHLRSLPGVLHVQLLNSGETKVEAVYVMLREDSDSQTVVNETVAVLKVKVLHQSLDECGLTGTIRSDKSDSRLEIDVEVDLVEDRGTIHAVADGSVL